MEWPKAPSTRAIPARSWETAHTWYRCPGKGTAVKGLKPVTASTSPRTAATAHTQVIISAARTRPIRSTSIRPII